MHRMTAYHHTHSEALSAAALDIGARAVAGTSHQPSSSIPQRRRVSSQALLGNEREVEIEHSGQLYRLRLTSLGKLILTK